ncbi:MAG: hypothetical protein M0027_00095 [Candidatus Dormibacteraeota bacterium]|jgi:hypothetical protein|nr:hypothetical protein [Candidatus Dormibacteraeota bacterium]
MTYLRSASPPTALGFGVVCHAPWLFDIAIRSTSQSLKRKKDYPPSRAQKLYGRPDVEYFMAEPHRDDEREFAVLGFGTAWPAYIVLTDDCAIEKCRGREGRAPTDWVTLAPLSYRALDDPENLALVSTLTRFPLPKDSNYGTDHVVLLARAFRVDSRDIWTATGELRAGLELLRQLDDETTDGLLQRWAAHSVRQGPLVGTDNAAKLAQLIRTVIDAEAIAEDLADGLTDLAHDTWEYENGPLEMIADASEAWSKNSQPPDVNALTESLRAILSRLQLTTQQVIDTLDRVRAEVKRTSSAVQGGEDGG